MAIPRVRQIAAGKANEEDARTRASGSPPAAGSCHNAASVQLDLRQGLSLGVHRAAAGPAASAAGSDSRAVTAVQSESERAVTATEYRPERAVTAAKPESERAVTATECKSERAVTASQRRPDVARLWTAGGRDPVALTSAERDAASLTRVR